MRERELVDAIERRLRPHGDSVLSGPGDDAAVVRARPVAVTSLDTVVEGVHFDLDTHSYADVGHKALASALSDLAAMGARPGEAYVSLALPFSQTSALELVGAIEELAAATATSVAGGDVVSAPVLVVSVTVVGWADDAGLLAYRAGAQPGDLVGVSGELGGSGAGLALLRGCGAALDPLEREALLLRHRRPEARLALGASLSAAGVSAMIDLSDGIATDAGHLAERSEVSLVLRLAELPLASGVVEVARELGLDPHRHAATAGEDYELLFTAPASRRRAIEQAACSEGVLVSWIGEVRSGDGTRLLGADDRPVPLDGYEHL